MNQRFFARATGCLALALAVGCASGDPSVVDPQPKTYFVDPDGETAVSPRALASSLAGYDVVFLGEVHDNVVGHQQHAELLRALHGERSDLALSFEMFERDVASELSGFMEGSVTEAAFVAAMVSAGNKWSGYERDYRPMLMFGKKHGLPAIAANVPRKLASQVAKQGVESVIGEPLAARDVWTRKDAYFDKFKAEMPFEGETLDNYYAAQCLKDCTMAESIADFLAGAGANPPLVLHKNGNFHSDSHLGTVAMLKQMRPDLKIAVVTMVEEGSEDGDASFGDFALMVPKQPRKDMGEHPVATSEESPHGESPHAASPHATSPHGENPHGESPHGTGAASTGRPALGFKPDYETPVDGCLVEAVTLGGPADKAGLKADDIIVELAEVPVDSFQGYMEAMSTVTVGSTIEVIVMRGPEDKREEKSLKIVVGSR